MTVHVLPDDLFDYAVARGWLVPLSEEEEKEVAAELAELRDSRGRDARGVYHDTPIN